MLSSDGTWDKVVNWLMSHDGAIVPWLVVVAGAIWFLLKALDGVLEKLIRLIEVYRIAGLPALLNRERRKAVRKRQAFCKVMAADLAYLAKKENWNDQSFTDLEAEVEVEGAYYPTTLHRLFRRPAAGLRRVTSLVAAIESTSEQTLLVVGEPGSGKTVALRHLASTIAEKGRSSSSEHALVPLYVNLKELDIPAGERVDASTIRRFVIDNVRRGDSDTASFVHDHWAEYRDRGIWFVLLDSFDEIPAVLHAPSGSRVVQEYTRAIHDFVNALGDCRSVLASREFKGPEQLPWQRLRILPLSEKRQRDLVARSFLDEPGQELALAHAMSSDNRLFENPMFLTLLCRHVRDTACAPVNDMDLLSTHIRRLANREAEYIQRKYGVAPADLLEAATRLAVLFAETPSLGLAPTRDEIARALAARPELQFDCEVLLPALVDVKIGRSDIEEARSGDRRFTFSHRRYQESLFVEFLLAKPAHIRPRELLTDVRWREYAVTLLQSQTVEAVQPLCAEAESVLAEYSRRESVIAVSYLPGLTYHTWRDDEVHLLRLLQEGVGRRSETVPEPLRAAVLRLLEPRWSNGDLLDRIAVMQLGGLLPHDVLTRWIVQSIDAGSAELEAAAVGQSVYLRQIPDEVAEFIRKHLADATILATGRTALLRLGALAQRLPESVGARYVVERCARLRAWMWPGRLFLVAMEKLGMLRAQRGVYAELTASELMFTIVMPGLLTDPVDRLLAGHPLYEELFFDQAVSGRLLLAYLVAVAVFVSVYRLRSTGHRLRLSSFLQRSIVPPMTPALRPLVRPVAALGVAMLPGLLFVSEPGLAVFVSVCSALFFFVAGLVVAGILGRRAVLKNRERLQAARVRHAGFAVALEAPSVQVLQEWIAFDATWISGDSIAARDLLRVALWRSKPAAHPIDQEAPPIVREGWTRQQFALLCRSLFVALEKAGWSVDLTAQQAAPPEALPRRAPATTGQRSHVLPPQGRHDPAMRPSAIS